MLPTYEAYYHDGKIDLKELPRGIKEAKVLITFLDFKKNENFPDINWTELEKKQSKVEKWVGILAGAEITDAKALRKEYIEKKHQ